MSINATPKQTPPSPPQDSWSVTVEIFKYILPGYLIVGWFTGLDWIQGVGEILSGGARTGAGWMAIAGIVLVIIFIAALVAGAIADGKSAKAKTPPPSPPVVAQRVVPQTPARQPEKPAAVLVDPPAPVRADPPPSVAKPEPKVRPAEQAALRNLQNILVDYGQEVISNQTQCERLLSERCWDVKREGVVLVAALRENLPQRLLKLPSTSLSKTAVLNYSAQLSQSTGLEESAAQFAVESWAKALGLQLQGA
jgi:type IV secretory pathway VirB10-like protein